LREGESTDSTHHGTIILLRGVHDREREREEERETGYTCCDFTELASRRERLFASLFARPCNQSVSSRNTSVSIPTDEAVVS